jgi:isoquinoline 1-oxidoreductase
MTGKAELGQNARTSVTQAAAEELRVGPETITVLMADTDLVPYDMGTFGSMTTPRMLPLVRRAAAAARETLVDLATKKWGVGRAELNATNGVVSGAGHSATYGELAAGQPMTQRISADVALTPTRDWKVMGTSLPKVDAVDFVTGKHEYTSDMHRRGMLFGKVVRPPSFHAELTSADTSQAEAMEGVKVVHMGDFLAVAAPTQRLARRALAAIKTTWDEKPQPSSKDLIQLLRGVSPTPSVAKGEKTFAQRYSCQYIAHVPLEPRAALAEWDGQKVTVYTGSQRPFGARDELVAALGLDTKHVRVIVPDTGSAYGGKHTGEAAVEAARIARAVGKPVKVIWTRQEEFTFAYFRPGGVADISSAVSKSGKLTGWTQDNYNSGPAAVETPYAVPGPRCEYHEAESPLRQASYRSLAACFNNFSRETHMDELAHELTVDPVAFRLQNLTNERLKAVLSMAADKFGWGNGARPSGRGIGIACGTEKGSFMATAVELAVEGSRVRLLRAVSAYDCGAIVNPDLLTNQVVGAVIQGIGGALFEEIDFANGRILNNLLSRYRVPRYSDIPVLETHLIDHRDIPSAGAGETPIICIAPAIGNAIFSATGQRLRDMPLRLR